MAIEEGTLRIDGVEVFYRRVAGAVPIAGSEPGLYRAPLVP